MGENNDVFSFIKAYIKPLPQNLFTKNYTNLDDFFSFMWKNCIHKYDNINELVDYLIFSDRFAHEYKYEIYSKYISRTLKCKLTTDPNINTNINNSVIHYAIVSNVRVDKPIFCELVNNLINDNVLNVNEFFEIVINYAQFPKAHSFLEMALNCNKLNEYHLSKILTNYKNGSCDILNHFIKWGIYPTHVQYISLVENRNLSDLKLMKSLRFSASNDFILASISSGTYPIDGLDHKTIITLTDDEKIFMKKFIFGKATFNKTQISNMKKQFQLEYDLDCMLDFCKNNGNTVIFKYLIDLGIKPSVECLRYLIPHHCHHKNVHKLLEMSI